MNTPKNSSPNCQKKCFSFAVGAGFLRSLAEHVLQEYGAGNTSLARVLILLPNRRACRALRDEFLDASGGKPLILPRIQPIGEVEDEALFISSMAGVSDGKAQPEQAIDSVRRDFLLTNLVLAFNQKNPTAGGNLAHALELARELASFLDEVNREGLDFSALADLAPENLAGHWQHTLDFLLIISRQWPHLLEGEGAQDGVVVRNKLLALLADEWQKNPPDFPIIAAGSTGSQPATAHLLKAIASLPLGAVFLPAPDLAMPEDEWNALTDTHPQYMLKKLLEKMDISRSQVQVLGGDAEDKKQRARQQVVRAIFAPPAATVKWKNMELPAESGLAGITLVEADNVLAEAKIIAAALRRALETPEKTAALITPDRQLARMVASNMQRFGVMVDDSAGRQLASSAPACFLRLVLEMVASRFAPAPLLAVLRHPLAACGIAPVACRAISRELEILLLRGIRRGDGLAGIITAAKDKRKTEIADFLTQLEEKSAAMSALFAPHHNARLEKMLAAHIDLAQWAAGGSDKLWAHEAGSALAEGVASWYAQADALPPFDPLTYPALFESLLAPLTYRPQAGLHPRLHILSPMEARLMSFDMVVLSGLNEGVWPKNAEADPWMSRPQRAAFGLSSAGRAVGQAAHDLQMLMFSAPEILLTRARKSEGTPTIPSRWWVRLATLLAGRAPQQFAAINMAEYFADAISVLEQKANIAAITAPAPCPPLSARPRGLWVTAIDRWLRDPYSIYARYILKLKKLEELDREPDFSDFGNLVHLALEHFTQKYPSQLPENVYDELLVAGKIAFADFMDRPAVYCLWWPRFERMAAWLAAEETARRKHALQVYSEVEGSLKLDIDGNEFTLSARIDRIEQLAGDVFNIVDYKTGGIPTKAERERGLANQLPLGALVVAEGELSPPISAKTLGEMHYLKLSGNAEKCDVTKIEADIAEARARLENLIRQFSSADAPYAAPADPTLVLKYNDFEHLTRRSEWEAV